MVLGDKKLEFRTTAEEVLTKTSGFQLRPLKEQTGSKPALTDTRLLYLRQNAYYCTLIRVIFFLSEELSFETSAMASTSLFLFV